MIEDSILDPCNMIRDCFKLILLDPRTSTYGTKCAQIMVTDQEIKQLLKDAPALRQQRLFDLVESPEKNNDLVHAKAIMELLKREAQKKRRKQINYSMHPPVVAIH
jgi:hypothetical protein